VIAPVVEIAQESATGLALVTDQDLVIDLA
jgi:hypothetical protein